MDKVLILYSNPANTRRLRLDKEARAISEVVSKLGLPYGAVISRHATTYNDLVNVLAEDQYDIIQFSTHGTAESVVLEGVNSKTGVKVSAERIASLLVKTQPHLKLAIFMSCFSAISIPILIKSASYLMTIYGEADDTMSINFIKDFYEHRFRGEAIHEAFYYAQELNSNLYNVLLSRRALDANKEKPLLQIYPKGGYLTESFLVDISDAEENIRGLDVPVDTFLSILSRKIRLHSRIFDFARERVYLPIGNYIGVFSWVNPNEVIKCHEILKIKPGTPEIVYDVWASMVLNYNDSVILTYRRPENLGTRKIYESALTNYKNILTKYLSAEKVNLVMEELIPDEFQMAKSLIKANLDLAEMKVDMEDFDSATINFEFILSSFHDLLDAMTARIAQKPQQR